MLRDQAERTHEVPDGDGELVTLTTLEVLVRQLIRDALKGDKFSRKELLRLLGEISPAGPPPLTPEALREAEAEDARRREISHKLSEHIEESARTISMCHQMGILRLSNGHSVMSPLGRALWALRIGGQPPEGAAERMAAVVKELEILIAEAPPLPPFNRIK